MPKRTQALERKMIEVTMATIERDGEAAVRVRDICRACGAREPALYLRFGSRANLIVAAQAERYRQAIACIVKTSLANLDTAMGLGDLGARAATDLEHHLRPDMVHRWACLNVLGSAITRGDLATAVSAVNNAAVERLAEGIDRARATGVIRPVGSSKALAAFYLGVVMSRFTVELDDSVVSPSEWNDVFVAAIVGVLAGPPPALSEG